jgi:homoserine dehydrogenase
MVKIALLGYGVVGTGVTEVLSENSRSIAHNAGDDIEIKYILCRRPRPESPLADRIVQDFSVIEQDPEVRIVVECIGGMEPANDYVRRALLAGKSVVTSNKELVAARGNELLEIAQEKNVSFLFEGSVGGGIPIIRPITQCLAANELDEVYGILNGTTNYILTEMAQKGATFDDALRRAQELGYAEADPSADVDGLDACRKICILSDLCFGRYTSPDAVYAEGIRSIAPEDVAYAKALGYKIKLLGRAVRTGPDTVTAYVAPHFVSNASLLSNVDGVMNGIMVRGNALGEAMFYGPGAGKRPTASAVVADIIDTVKHFSARKYLYWKKSRPGGFTDFNDLITRFFVRTQADLEDIGYAFGNVRFATVPGAPDGEYAFITAPMYGHALKVRVRNLSTVSAVYRILD